MHFLIDADFPRSVSDVLQAYGHETIDVRDIGLRNATDTTIARYAQQEGLCLLTGDFDFSDICTYPPAKYAGIVVLVIPPTVTSRWVQASVCRSRFSKAPQCSAHLDTGWLAGDHQADCRERRMNLPLARYMAGIHPCGGQRFRVGCPFVPERVELTHHDHGGRQPREISRSQRRSLWVCALGGLRIVIPEPLHERRRQDVAVGILAVTRSGEITVRHRRDQELPGDTGASGSARHLAHAGGNVAPSAPARDRQWSWEPHVQIGKPTAIRPR
jgi:predicted nuclease of predicted toxin-antitoxin system